MPFASLTSSVPLCRPSPIHRDVLARTRQGLMLQRRHVQIFNNMLYNKLVLLLWEERTNVKMPAYATVSLSIPGTMSSFEFVSHFDSLPARLHSWNEWGDTVSQVCESIRTIQPHERVDSPLLWQRHWSHRSSRLLNGTLVPLFLVSMVPIRPCRRTLERVIIFAQHQSNRAVMFGVLASDSIAYTILPFVTELIFHFLPAACEPWHT